MTGAGVTIVVGFVSGVLSGAFGIGGGMVTTPAIRLLLGYPALVAVGTPLPVILPGALTGAWAHLRRGAADLRAGVILGLAGCVTSVMGAYLSKFAGGTVVMLATATVIAWAAVDMLLQQRRRARDPVPAPGAEEADPDVALALSSAPGARRSWQRLAAVGLAAGLYSGFLGLGGGFVVVPGLMRYCGFTVKEAIGTSLVTVAILAVPGTLVHSLLGHVDWRLALLLAIGVVPGAWLGAHAATRASDRAVALSFAALLAVTGIWLAISEIVGLR